MTAGRVAVVAACAAAWLAACGGRERARPAAGPGPSAGQGVAAYEWFVLALSWVPGYCAEVGEARGGAQCAVGSRHGFVVHGLWPQGGAAERGRCAATEAVPESVVAETLPVMPSRWLIEHEWERHGACMGVRAARYFAMTREAFARVVIPAPLRAPEAPVAATAAAVVGWFVDANPGLPRDAVVVACRGRYVSDVRLCMDRAMRYQRCGPRTADPCREGELEFRPVR